MLHSALLGLLLTDVVGVEACSFTYLGCHRDGGGTGDAMPCTDCSDQKRLMRFHLPGCPTAQYWPPPAPGTPPGPTCVPKSVNKEYCALTCVAWQPWGSGSTFYIGLESGKVGPGGVADYAECSCDVRLAIPTLPKPFAEKICSAHCPGDLPGLQDRCGGVSSDVP